MRFLGTLFAVIAVASPATAEWQYSPLTSAFRSETDHVIGVVQGTDSLMIRCRTAIARAYYIKTGVPNSLSDRMGNTTGAFRVDDGPVVSEEAMFTLSDGKLTVEFPVDPEDLRGLLTAKNRFAVAFLSEGNVVYETSFGVEEAEKQVSRLYDECREE